MHVPVSLLDESAWKLGVLGVDGENIGLMRRINAHASSVVGDTTAGIRGWV